MGLGLFDNVRRTVAHTFGQSIGFFVGFVVLHQGRVGGGALLIPQCLNVYSQFTHVIQQLLVPIVFPSYLLPIDLFHDCSGGFGQKRLVGFVRVHKGGGGDVRGGGGRGGWGVYRRDVLQGGMGGMGPTNDPGGRLPIVGVARYIVVDGLPGVGQ